MDIENIQSQSTSEFDLLIHPRVPPLVRTHPPVASLSLFQTQEPEEERHARENLGVGVVNDSMDAEPTETRSVEPQKISPEVHNAVDRQPQPDPPVVFDLVVRQSSPPPPPLQAPQNPAPMNEPTTILESAMLDTPMQERGGGEDEEEELPTINMDSDSD
jgi:hypothetical protein